MDRTERLTQFVGKNSSQNWEGIFEAECSSWKSLMGEWIDEERDKAIIKQSSHTQN